MIVVQAPTFQSDRSMWLIPVEFSPQYENMSAKLVHIDMSHLSRPEKLVIYQKLLNQFAQVVGRIVLSTTTEVV